jgi:hypothetical protein
MDPTTLVTTLVMERLAGEWAAFMASFACLALRGTIGLAVAMGLVVVLASLPWRRVRQSARIRQAAGVRGTHQTGTAGPEVRRAAHLRLLVETSAPSAAYAGVRLVPSSAEVRPAPSPAYEAGRAWTGPFGARLSRARLLRRDAGRGGPVLLAIRRRPAREPATIYTSGSR